jgi:quinol monooxygenase YgiN
MYGTVTRYRLKPGSEAAAVALSDQLTAAAPPGYIGAYTFRLDSGGDEYITASVWTDRETYAKNSDSEQQQRWFEQVRGLLVGDPQWNDGEVIHAVQVEGARS